jgi:hypothetical protein
MTTIQVDGAEIWAVIHIVRIVMSIVTMLAVGLLIWWAVRPSRRARSEELDAEPADNEDLWRSVDRMEERLAVLERALADQVEPPPGRASRGSAQASPT